MTSLRAPLGIAVLTGLLAGFSLRAAEPDTSAITDISKTDADFQVIGEYLGMCQLSEGKPVTLGVQVALVRNEESGKFRATGYVGGLPGAGGAGRHNLTGVGETKRGVVQFGEFGYAANSDRRFRSFRGKAEIEKGVLRVLDGEGKQLGTLKRITRTSPTLEAKPPPGAIVLFDGSTAEHFPRGKMTEDKLLIAGCKSQRKFARDFRLHVEFRVPYKCTRGHGNSGVYLQDIYEIQIFDSLGRGPGQSFCGGLYAFRTPDLDMTFPPLAWQTFDVFYRVPQFDSDKRLTQPARVTVYHNGYRIHANVDLRPNATLSPSGGPLFLQAHGSPVHFRNIWVVEEEYAPPMSTTLEKPAAILPKNTP